MDKNTTVSNKRYILVLIGVLIAAIVLFFLLRGTINLADIGKTVKNPTDTEDNLSYGKKYHPLSDNVLERDGIVIKNFGSSLKAQDLTTGVCVDACSIAEESEDSITCFSEYAGYFYMYDGKDVYRSVVNSPEELRTTIKDCLKFEPMGNYLYSLKIHNGEQRLFRCSITGAYEEMLFQDTIEDFWASDGNLFMQLSTGQYRWYDLISENTLEHTLPENAQSIVLDGDCIFYLSETDNAVVYWRCCDASEDTALPFSSVIKYNAANGKVGLFISNSDGSVQAAWCRNDGSDVHVFQERFFSKESTVDISENHLFITEQDGKTWATSLEDESWYQLFDGVD
ncbi:MAG: DUF5050 domain-containing protein [Eubacterium sp.]|nr:DUF5050 domain-containing protein [Eubacterium sp.]